jgi:hypothetical protein
MTVEFGLVSPVLITVLFGIVEYGTLFSIMLSIQSATRDGARWGATPNYSIDTAPDAAVQHVRESLELLGLDCSESTELAGDCSIEAIEDPLEGYLAITVTTRIEYTPVTGGLLPVPSELVARSSFVLSDQTPAE